MAAREVEGVACKQADGRDPKTGELRKDKTNGAVSVRIDSARAAGPRSSALGCGSSGSGTACSRLRNWWCCPTGCRGSEPPTRRPRTESDLHSLLQDQQRPNALRPLSEARTAGRVRRRGKRLQANRQQPLQAGRVPLVEGRSQALLAVRCCLKNNRWPDFLEWRACSAADA